MQRRLVPAGLVVAVVLGVAACGSSGSGSLVGHDPSKAVDDVELS